MQYLADITSNGESVIFSRTAINSNDKTICKSYLQETLENMFNESNLSNHLKKVEQLLFESSDNTSDPMDFTGFDQNLQDFALLTIEAKIPSNILCLVCTQVLVLKGHLYSRFCQNINW
jgi:hypothetical protein